MRTPYNYDMTVLASIVKDDSYPSVAYLLDQTALHRSFRSLNQISLKVLQFPYDHAPLPLEYSLNSYSGSGKVMLKTDFVVRQTRHGGYQVVSYLAFPAVESALDLMLPTDNKVRRTELAWDYGSIRDESEAFVVLPNTLGVYATKAFADMAAKYANRLTENEYYLRKPDVPDTVEYLIRGYDYSLTTNGDAYNINSLTTVVRVPNLTFFGWVLLRLSGLNSQPHFSVVSERSEKWDAQWERLKNTAKTVVFRAIWGTNGKNHVKTA